MIPPGSRRLLVALFLCACVAARGQIVLTNFSPASPLKIMANGDSITDDGILNGAWRKFLQPLLETNGFPFTFVGRQTSFAEPGFTKIQHEGYSGAVIAGPGYFGAHQYSAANNYLQYIDPQAFTNAIPDVMLIMIGVNDIGHLRNPFFVATNDMARLLNIIFSNAPNATVVLTKVTREELYSAYGPTAGMNIPIYNAALQGVVNQRRALGQKVYLADMYSVVDYPSMFIADDLHPNATGFQHIAQEWLARLEAITLQTNVVVTNFIYGGATWKYNDTGANLGTNWTLPAYNDSGWSNGPARLGYGDSVVATTVSYGPQSTNKYVTTYFRRPFVVPWNMVVTNLNFRVAQCDGAVVYLNGQEMYRTNLPAGPISYTTLATSAATYYPRYIFYPTNVPVNLTAGTNWITAEVHLSSVVASAMGFDMELIGSGYPLSAPLTGSLQLSVPSSANENAGTLAGAGHVTASVAPTNNLIVSLTSSDTTAATVPATVVIPAGQTNATFDITAVDDGIVDGDKTATITATALNYDFATASIIVHNTDQPFVLQLSVPAGVTEGAGTLVGQGNISATPTPTNNLTIYLLSSETTEITVPATVVIPAGQSSAAFNLTVLDDGLLDVNHVIAIVASGFNCISAQAGITIYENDTATLSVSLPASASETAGILTNAGRVSVGTAVATNFTVALGSSDTSRLIVPPTAIIPTGQTSAVFNLTVVTNHIIGGSEIVAVTAHIPNWTDGSASITILYDDPLPNHFAWSTVPSPQWIGEPFPVTITAQDASNNILDYRLPATLSALMPGTASATKSLLGSPSAQSTYSYGVETTAGYSFTPDTNLVVVAVRSYFGDKVSLWTDNGVLLASQSVVSVPGTWVETPLTNAVVLLAGVTYRVGAHVSNSNNTLYLDDNLQATFPDGTINESWAGLGDGFPNGLDSGQYLVDLRYGTDVKSVPFSPAVSGTFTSGTWSGNMAVLQAATNVMLEASAGTYTYGFSNPFNVPGTPRLAISSLGNSVVLSWPVAATNFNLEQGTNLVNWTNDPVTPIAVGDRYDVTNTLGAASTFYRLHKP